MKVNLLVSSAILCVITALPAMADEETDQLRAQIKALEARLDVLEKKQATQAQTVKSQPASVQQAQVANVGSVSSVATTSSGQPVTVAQANVSYKPGQGLMVSSPDNAFKFHVGGYVQADDHAFIGNNPAGNTDQFFIRSARPIFEASYDNFSARLMLDYGNNQTTLLDAYGDYRVADPFTLRVGKFKDPIGIERWQSEQNTLFVERGMTTNLVPYRDNGVETYGEIIPHTLEYQVALTNGAPDLVNSTNGSDNDQTVTARVFAHPLYEAGVDALKGLGVGVAASYGSHSASVATPNLTSGYVTPSQTKFFSYAATAYADGAQWRINPEVMYYHGPFSLLGEYVLEDQGIKNGAGEQTLQNYAWEAITTYVLTGEDARFDGVVPRNNFDPKAGTWGAFELAGRVSQLRVDNSAFPVFASLATSAKAATETTLGGNWYLNPNVKLVFDFELTDFEGGAASGDREYEKAVLSRAQFKF